MMKKLNLTIDSFYEDDFTLYRIQETFPRVEITLKGPRQTEYWCKYYPGGEKHFWLETENPDYNEDDYFNDETIEVKGELKAEIFHQLIKLIPTVPALFQIIQKIDQITDFDEKWEEEKKAEEEHKKYFKELADKGELPF